MVYNGGYGRIIQETRRDYQSRVCGYMIDCDDGRWIVSTLQHIAMHKEHHQKFRTQIEARQRCRSQTL